MALPLEELIRPSNWPELDDPKAIWNTYQAELEGRGYHLMGSEAYRTLGKDDGLPPPAAVDPFHPKDGENFIHHWRLNPGNLHSRRIVSAWQPNVIVCFAIDRYQRQVVFKAVPSDDSDIELKVLRLLSSDPLRADERNRAIPVLEFVETRHDFFLHENRIAHGDIHYWNILINHADHRDLGAPKENDFRLGFNVEYAYIDFESSHILEPGTSCGHPISHPPEGAASPEQEAALDDENATIDVFAADIYNLGKTLEGELREAFRVYGGNHMPDPLEYNKILSDMTSQKPSERPSAVEVVGFLRNLSGCILG
ncbi:hypothetical protein FB45DRAFT_1055379 [Roridomyces roridus]|uniref:Protein kinase domain-containing protein n=1 Tax=Roridomyces roridus TaxID=1738132 RepID=A0AAD7C558_9AGAR|nr:hypothetical protein FB45DRAFT_1055379 [Roridomyces roridus]